MSKKQLRILLVEDEGTSRLFAKHALERAGFAVDFAVTAQQGLDMLQASYDNYCLIVTDIELPDFTGIELVRGIRSWEEKSKAMCGLIPIVALSSQIDEEMKQVCVAAGMQNAYKKPLAKSAVEQIAKLAFLRKISPRESEVLALYNQGYSRKDAANILGLSESTYAWHLRQIRSKFRVVARKELQALEDSLKEAQEKIS